MRKKLLSIVLCGALVLGSVNVTTFAAEQYGTGVLDEDVFELPEDTGEETTDTAIEDGNKDEELAEEHENLGFDTEAVSEQAIEDSSEEGDTKKSAQEDLRDDAEKGEGFRTEASMENASDLIIVEGELEGVYQFGDAPSERKVAAYSLRSGEDENVAAAEKYIYEQMKQRSTMIDIRAYNMLVKDIPNLVSGVLNEHPDLYFVEKGFSYSYSGSICTVIKPTYIDDDTLDDDAFYEGVDAALACVNSGMSDLEKAIALHDYLAVNCEYDKENFDKNTVPGISHSAYGPLVKRISVCDGYALAYKYLLSKVGIDCYMVTSKAMAHAWNLIVLDGEYYQVDVTWDDPTWDLVGRARHEFMFCSDNAFRSKTAPHYNWEVTEGAYVVNYSATDTLYDNAFWQNVNSPLVLAGDGCYYTAYDSTAKKAKIKMTSLSDITALGEDFCDIGVWPVWESNYFYTSAYSGLFCVNNRLYYNDKESIYSVSLEGDDKKQEFKADTSTGYIYGSALCGGKVYYSLHQTPNLDKKETRLVADIDFSTGNPEAKGYITASKTKILYRYGESINTDDLRVTYHDTDGTSRQLKSSEYKTNVSQINTTVPGKKTLIITYRNGSEELTYTVELTVLQKEEGSETDSSESEAAPTNPSESESNPSEPESDSSESGTNSSEPESDPSESGSVPTNPSESESDSSKPETTPSEPESNPSESGSVPTNPSESESDSSEPETNSSESESNPSESGTTPSEPGSNQSEPETPPSEPGSNPSEPDTPPSEPGTPPSEPGTNPSEPESNPSESETDPAVNKSDIQIVGLEKTYQYTGDKIIPAFDVIDYDIPGGKLLAQGVDYTVTYKDNKDVGTATIIVKGKGNYAAVRGNEAKATFRIVDADDAGKTSLANIKGAKISKLVDVDYNRAPHIPTTITLTYKTKEVSYIYDTVVGKYKRADGKPMDVNIAVSNNINKGTANVLVSGVDDKGKAVKIKGKFKIKPIDLSQKKVVIKTGKAVYSPNGAVPASLTVTCEGKSLEAGKDYTVKYAKNKEAGEATLTVIGKGNYTKKAQPATYTISAADMSDFKVAAVTANEGTKVGKIKATVVDKNGNALKAKQYELEVYPVNKGTAIVGTTPHEASYELKAGDVIHVVARANDNTNLKKGKTTAADFTVGKDIAKAKFTLTPEAKNGIAYTGSEIRLEEKHFASVTYKDGANLHMKKADGSGDYEIVSYTNNVNKGTATVVIKGINKYSGTNTVKFKITQKAITNLKP